MFEELGAGTSFTLECVRNPAGVAVSRRTGLMRGNRDVRMVVRRADVSTGEVAGIVCGPDGAPLARFAIRFEGASPVSPDSRRGIWMRRAVGDPQEKRLTDPQEQKAGLIVGAYRRLHAHEPGAFTPLKATPGQYIRIKPLNETLSYVERVDAYGERVDAPSGSVTWSGELRMVVKEVK